MSAGCGLGTWFGGTKQQKDAPKKAILQLRGTLEMLSKREQHLQRQMDEQDAIARKNVSSNKNRTFFYPPERIPLPIAPPLPAPRQDSTTSRPAVRGQITGAGIWRQ